LLFPFFVKDMTLINFLFFVAMGCGVGFLAGLFGVGGGIIMVPILIFSYEHLGVSSSVLTHMAIGTSLFVIIFGSVMSAYQHRKQGNVDWRLALILGFSSAIAAFATSKFAAAINGRYLQVAFALFVLAAAIRMLTEGERSGQQRADLRRKPKMIGLVGVGFAAGVISALAGIGGGVFTIPMMYYLLNMPLKLVIGTSSTTIVITSVFSVTGYVLNGMGHTDLPSWSFGFVDLQRGIALAIGSIFLARVGAYVSFKTRPHRLRKMFAIFTILVSVYILFK
jgi:uncharacterized membrane protein YfcA